MDTINVNGMTKHQVGTENVIILGSDISGFGSSKTIESMIAKRKLLQDAFEAVEEYNKINSKIIHGIDTGDGIFLVFKKENQSVFPFINKLFLKLENSLNTHNKINKDNSISIRSIVHCGEVILTREIDARNNHMTAVGTAINETARYLDSTPLRTERKISKKNNIFGYSEPFYNEMLTKKIINEKDFRLFPVTVKEFKGKLYGYHFEQ